MSLRGGVLRLLVSLLVSGVFLLWLYSGIDVGGLVDSARGASAIRLLIGFLLLAPLVGATAWRLRTLLLDGRPLSLRRAHALVLMAGAVNVIAPARLGDLSKLALRQRPSRIAAVTTLSAVVWLVNLCQIWLFAWALGGSVPFFDKLALAPLAALSGLVPFTLAGAGSRDVAITFLYAPFLGTPGTAALGVLCTARYFRLAGIGAPVLATRATAPFRLRSSRVGP